MEPGPRITRISIPAEHGIGYRVVLRARHEQRPPA